MEYFPFFFLCFKQDIPTVTLAKKTVPVMGGSVENRIPLHGDVCVSRQQPLSWMRLSTALGLCLSTELSLAVEPGV